MARQGSQSGRSATQSCPEDVSMYELSSSRENMNGSENGAKAVSTSEVNAEDESYPKGLRLALIVLALFSSIFIVAISQTVLATAIPTITSIFDSYDDIAWYSAGEQITAVALQLPFGRAYSVLNNKFTFLGSVIVYLVGSAICGSAITSVALIVGRAIQGVGMAGVFGGTFIIIARITPLRTRSLFAGLFGAAYAVASVIGPVIGGAFTTRLSWRWCFYFNLPIGAVVIVIITFCLPAFIGNESSKTKKTGWLQTILRFDPFGTTLLLIALVCLMLALQWGGAQYEWSSGPVIAVLVVFACAILPWIVLQYFQGDEATVPLSIVKQRSVAASNLYLLFLNGSFGILIYYLPAWLQSIHGDSAQSSGLKQLALCISTALGSVIAGGLVALIGYYNYFIILGSLLTTAGAAMLMNIQSGAAMGFIIGAQILGGAGVGVGGEQANVAVQTVLPQDKIAKGTSMTLFTRLLGIALFLPVAQSILQTTLSQKMGASVAASIYGDGGATEIRENLQRIFGSDTVEFQAALKHVNDALTRPFMLALILAAISFPFGLLVEWKSVKGQKREMNGTKKNEETPTP